MAGLENGPMGFAETRSRAFRGFVLAEVLVVAVIIGALAAVAIPVYSGYITSQKKAVAKSIAQTAAVAANVYYRRYGTTPIVSQLNLYISNPSNYTVTISGHNIIVTDISNSGSPISDTASF